MWTLGAVLLCPEGQGARRKALLPPFAGAFLRLPWGCQHLGQHHPTPLSLQAPTLFPPRIPLRSNTFPARCPPVWHLFPRRPGLSNWVFLYRMVSLEKSHLLSPALPSVLLPTLLPNIRQVPKQAIGAQVQWLTSADARPRARGMGLVVECEAPNS